MKTNKKVWATSLCAILLGITVYSGYHTYNKYQEINESLLTLRDVGYGRRRNRRSKRKAIS